MAKPKHPNPSPHSLSTTPSQFFFTLTKIATVQILKSNGYKSAQSSALDALTRITTLYLHSLSSLSVSRANSRGHSHCSLHDVVFALLDLHSLPSPGFLKPNTLSQLRNYLSAPPPPPFPKEIKYPLLLTPPRYETPPSFENLSKRGNEMNPRFETFLPETPRQVVDVSKRRDEVPPWLPPLPRFETGAAVEDVSKRGEGESLVKVMKGERRKKEKKGWKGEGCGLMGKRERVRFKIKTGKRRESGVEVGGDGKMSMKMRNGVCRGGKRVSLVGKKLGGNYFCDDDDDNDENCLV